MQCKIRNGPSAAVWTGSYQLPPFTRCLIQSSLLCSLASSYYFLLLIFPFPFSMSESDSVMPLYTGLIHPCFIHRTTHRQTNSRRFLFGSIYSWGRRQESHCVVRNLDLLRRETVGDAYLYTYAERPHSLCVFGLGNLVCVLGLEYKYVEGSFRHPFTRPFQLYF